MIKPRNFENYIHITAFTDGSAVVRGKNAGRGGFGTYFPPQNNEEAKAFSKGYRLTKTGRMEITALLYAILAIPDDKYCEAEEGIKLTVYSDSEYVVKAFTDDRLMRWQLDGWTNTSGAVKNQDLWKKVLSALGIRSQLHLIMKHIKGHQFDKEKDPEKKKQLLNDPIIKGNVIADRLADYKRHQTLHEDLDSLN